MKLFLLNIHKIQIWTDSLNEGLEGHKDK